MFQAVKVTNKKKVRKVAQVKVEEDELLKKVGWDEVRCKARTNPLISPSIKLLTLSRLQDSSP